MCVSENFRKYGNLNLYFKQELLVSSHIFIKSDLTAYYLDYTLPWRFIRLVVHWTRELPVCLVEVLSNFSEIQRL